MLENYLPGAMSIYCVRQGLSFSAKQPPANLAVHPPTVELALKEQAPGLCFYASRCDLKLHIVKNFDLLH